MEDTLFSNRKSKYVIYCKPNGKNHNKNNFINKSLVNKYLGDKFNFHYLRQNNNNNIFIHKTDVFVVDNDLHGWMEWNQLALHFHLLKDKMLF